MVPHCTTDGGSTAFEEDRAEYTVEQLEAYLEITDSDAIVYRADPDLKETPTDIPENAVAYVDGLGDDMLRFAVENAAIPTLSVESVRGDAEFWILALDEPLKHAYTDEVDDGR